MVENLEIFKMTEDKENMQKAAELFLNTLMYFFKEREVRAIKFILRKKIMRNLSNFRTICRWILAKICSPIGVSRKNLKALSINSIRILLKMILLILQILELMIWNLKLHFLKNLIQKD
jgi:hypothetical protein